MLLQISTTHVPATDLGYLLAKNPANAQSFSLSFGRAHAFYPRADAGQCDFALLLEVDPIALVRGKGRGRSDGPLEQYVNDRPYIAGSFASVAIAQVLRSALSGQSRERPELAQIALPLEARVDVVPCSGDGSFVRSLFEPLGYEVALDVPALDPAFDWGHAPCAALTLRGAVKLSELLSHLYVLLPVLDDAKHYFIGEDEVEKLLKRGAGWLETHPQRDAIVARYLKRQRKLVNAALEHLERLAPEAVEEVMDEAEAQIEKPLSLHQIRLDAVLETLKGSGAQSVLDLGCGEGRLLRALLDEKQFERIIGVDASHRALTVAAEKLHLERLAPLKRERLMLLHGALTYRDDRLKNFDAAALVEVVEHLDPARLPAFEKAIWEWARPQIVILTTPNREYNAHWASLPAGKLRHRDHRFEWTRAEFAAWAQRVASENGYRVEISPLGPLDEALGAPSQMAIFRR